MMKTIKTTKPTTRPDIWLIVDLEATCWEDGIMPNGERQSVDNMEIIEIGCAVARESGEILDSRSIFVRPTENPILTPFCTSLTAITQEMVNGSFSLDLVMSSMNKYVLEYDLKGWCSWGDYDRRMFEAQTQRLGCYLDLLSFPHVNIKKLWVASTGHSKKRSGLMNALERHGLEFDGHYHRGVDDARNMARLLPFMNWDLKDQFITLGQPRKSEW